MRLQSLILLCCLTLTVPALAGCASPDGGDAATLDGKGPTDFAQSGQGCTPGAMVSGIDAMGGVVCSTDRVGLEGDYVTADQTCQPGRFVTGFTATGLISCDPEWTGLNTGWASIGPAAFTARYGEDEVYKDIGQGFAYVATQNSALGGIVAPIQLPHGASIDQFVFRFRDEDGAGDVTGRLQAYSASDGSFRTLATVASSGTPGKDDGTVALANERVNNLLYSYAVFVTGATSGTLGAGGAAVHYTLPDPL